MQHAESAGAIRPDQHQGIFSFRNAAQLLLNIGGGLHGMTIHFRDDVTAAKSGVIG
jgi:hypothetical protein